MFAWVRAHQKWPGDKCFRLRKWKFWEPQFFSTFDNTLLTNLFISFLSVFISLIELKTFLYITTYLFLFLTYLFLSIYCIFVEGNLQTAACEENFIFYSHYKKANSPVILNFYFNYFYFKPSIKMKQNKIITFLVPFKSNLQLFQLILSCFWHLWLTFQEDCLQKK